MSFALSTLLMVLLFGACGIAAGAVQRHLGLVSIAHAAVLGTGAYSYALSTRAGSGPALGLAVAVSVGTLAGVALIAAAERIRGESYALVTFGIQIIWLGAVSNLGIFGGALGIPGIPGPHLAWLLVFAVAVAVAAAAGHQRVQKTPLAAGLAVLARGTELAQALGLPVRRILLIAGAPYGAVLGFAGALLAAYVGFIDSTLFGVGVSVSLLAVGFFTVAKGAMGGLLGALLIVGLPQILRLIGLSSAATGYLQAAIGGLALVTVSVLWLSRDRTG